NGPGAIAFSMLLERVLGYVPYHGESAFSIGGTQVKSILSQCYEADQKGDEESIAETQTARAHAPKEETKKTGTKGPARAAVMSLSPNKRRYALLPRNANKFDNILKVANSPVNWNGDFLHIVVGTPQAGVGINIANALEFHALTTDPNEKGDYQEVMRIVRASSFDAILKHLPSEAKGRAQVRIHHHVATA